MRDLGSCNSRIFEMKFPHATHCKHALTRHVLLISPRMQQLREGTQKQMRCDWCIHTLMHSWADRIDRYRIDESAIKTLLERTKACSVKSAKSHLNSFTHCYNMKSSRGNAFQKMRKPVVQFSHFLKWGSPHAASECSHERCRDSW